MSNTLADVERAYYGSLLGYTDAKLANTSLSALKLAFFATVGSPSGGSSANPATGNSNFHPLDLMPVTGYGDSYFQESASNGGLPVKASANGGPLNRLQKKHNGVITNQSYGGSRMPECAFQAIGNVFQGTDRHYIPGTPSGLVVVNAGTNDIATDANAGNAFYQLGYRNSMRALVASVSAGITYDSVNFTKGAAWSDLAVGNCSGGSTLKTATVGAAATFTQIVAVPASGEVDVVILVTDGTANFSGTLTLTVDGVSAAVVSQNDGMKLFTSNVGAQSQVGFVHALVTLTGLTPGNRTIGGYLSAGSAVYVDFISTRSATPPLVCFIKPPKITSTVVVGATTSAALWTANSAAYYTIMDEVAAQFPNVITVDLMAMGWDPAVHLGLDLVHPNDRGCAFIASAVSNAVRTKGWFAGLNVLTA